MADSSESHALQLMEAAQRTEGTGELDTLAAASAGTAEGEETKAVPDLVLHRQLAEAENLRELKRLRHADTMIETDAKVCAI
jgi:hypothetical protein